MHLSNFAVSFDVQLRSLQHLGALAIVAIAACTLTVDTNSLTNHDCGAGEKYCAGSNQCVSTSDPVYGCLTPNCASCFFPHAQTTQCDNRGSCVIGTCTAPWAQCGEAQCSINLATTVDHCGQCGTSCVPTSGTDPHGTAQCVNSSCQMNCNTGWVDCDGIQDNGCECAVGKCVAGVCQP